MSGNERVNDVAADANDRALELLQLGGAAIQSLGAALGDHAARAIEWLDAIGRDSAGLLEVNRRLLPVMQAFQRRRRRPRWWRSWLGEELEHDLALPGLMQAVESWISDGIARQAALDQRLVSLHAEDRDLDEQIANLERELAACRLLLGSSLADRRRQAGWDEAERQRLERRCGNMEAMVTATELTREQFRLAAAHARTVADRFVEIHQLLLPLWKQTVGFDLFSRRSGLSAGGDTRP